LEKPFTETQDFDGFSSALFIPVSSHSYQSSEDSEYDDTSTLILDDLS